jgi:hypothetical protein
VNAALRIDIRSTDLASEWPIVAGKPQRFWRLPERRGVGDAGRQRPDLPLREQFGDAMEYSVEQVDRVGELLLALPAIEPSKRKLDKQAAVKRLKEQISTVQQRGYTLEQIAASLSGAGLQITTPTLKSYLQRARKPGGRGASKAPRRSAPPAVRREQVDAAKMTPLNAAPAAARPERAVPVDGAGKSTRSEFIAVDRERL